VPFSRQYERVKIARPERRVLHVDHGEIKACEPDGLDHFRMWAFYENA
jgi:hypothetical protein